MHMEFVTQLYRDQVAEGRYFLHEHPQFASSWDLECVKRLMQLPGVDRTPGDQCQYGAEAPHGPMKGWPVMKPTGCMSNSREILKALSKRCTALERQHLRAPPVPGLGAAESRAGSMPLALEASAEKWQSIRANCAEQ